MPVAVVVGGQFGSEGKGKVALEFARAASEKNVTLVRVGGPNSGHTGYDRHKKRFALRQLPAGCIDRNVDVVFPAGSYIDVELLLSEIALLKFPSDRIFISHHARVILQEHKAWEQQGKLESSIGSTGSGVGGAVMASVARGAVNFPLVSLDAQHCEPLQSFLCDTTALLRRKLDHGERVIIEGSQGFGLSLLDGGYWPKATSRSTTAAAALAEAGLSPIDVDEVIMVLRSFPIRVAGDSGPLSRECTWQSIAEISGRRVDDIREYTTVTNRLRRVGHFDAELVRSAIAANNPSKIVMNHMDYIAEQSALAETGSRVREFISKVERDIEREIDYFGFTVFDILPRKADLFCAPH